MKFIQVRISVDLVSTVGHCVSGRWKTKPSKVLRITFPYENWLSAVEKVKKAWIGYSALLNHWNVQGTGIRVSTYLTPFLMILSSG